MKDFNINNIDDQFKHHFSGASTPVEQPASLWNAIQEKRQPPKKRFLFWVLTSSLAVLSLGSLIYFASTNQASPSPIEQTIDLSNQAIAEQKSSTKKIAEQEITEPKVAAQSIIEQNAKEDNNSSKIDSAKKSINTALPIAKKSTTKSDTYTNNSTTTIISTQLSQNSTPIASATTIEAMKTTPAIIYTTKSESAIPQSTPTIQEAISSKAETKQNLVKNTTEVLAVENRSPTLLESAPIALDIPFEKMPEEKDAWDKCEVKEKGSLFVNIYGQADAPFEEITNDYELFPQTLAYINNWDEKFDPFLSYIGGIQVGYKFPWNGYASVGLAYQHFQTKFRETQLVVERTTIYDEMASFYIDQETGETIWVADSVVANKIYEQVETHANNHQLWHIPIQVGYMMDKNNFRFGANVEALVNISKRYKGHFLNFNKSVDIIDTAKDKEYMSTSLGISLSAGLHVGYILKEHWEVYLNPRFRYNRKSYLDDRRGLSIRRNFAGLRTGLLYHF